VVGLSLRGGDSLVVAASGVETDQKADVAEPEQYAAQQGMSLAMLAALRLPQFRAKMAAQGLQMTLIRLVVAGSCPDDLAGHMVFVCAPSSNYCYGSSFAYACQPGHLEYWLTNRLSARDSVVRVHLRCL